MKLRELIFVGVLAVSILALSGCSGQGKVNTMQQDGQDANITVHLNGEKEPVEARIYSGDGYKINIPKEGFRYERSIDDGAYEDSWESVTKDLEIKVLRYVNIDENKARGIFARDNDDYIFEDFLGETICGIDEDGDRLWFKTVTNGSDAYIVSWEYPKSATQRSVAILESIAASFEIEK